MPLRDKLRALSPKPLSTPPGLGKSITHPVDLEQLDNAWPPSSPVLANETPADKERRLEAEREAKRRNDAIEAEIEQDRLERKKRRIDVKIILLGQAESGKSTILRNFHLKFAPAAFQAEVTAWRAVIDLNLVRSVLYILDVVNGGASGERLGSPNLSDEMRRLRVTLSPLRTVEAALSRFLADERTAGPGVTALKDASGNVRGFDVQVGRGSKWKALFSRNTTAQSSREYPPGYQEVENARRVIEACRDDMAALWAHPTVRESLVMNDVALQFQSGFFLDQVERIAAPGYEPSIDDVLKARIQTMGVEEHTVKLESAAEAGQVWSIIDVGGSRHQRAAWIPFFEDINMLIFLAPASAFDQTLEEDPTVNRLWDSFLIWKTVCSSRLLRNVAFILCLNKYDILDAKLKSGVQFAQHVTSYKNRPNETEPVLLYLKDKFASIFKQTTISHSRALHTHFTCATDAKATALVLTRIREHIFTGNFQDADLI
ncbi:G-alpha-domain-containing protein [Peniophora sp. CONT]|nr:G-alpha-domain-containing protein [Peniophora sp. CONT]